jgi:hypothetical protein
MPSNESNTQKKKCEEHYLVNLLEKRNCPDCHLLGQLLYIKAPMTVLTMCLYAFMFQACVKIKRNIVAVKDEY